MNNAENLVVDATHPWDPIQSTNTDITTMLILEPVVIDVFPPNVETLIYQKYPINLTVFPDFQTMPELTVPNFPVGLKKLILIPC